MRTFLALELPEDIKNNLFDKILYYKNQDLGIKWVERNNLHITLQFIGKTIKEDLPKIKNYIQDKFSDLAKLGIQKSFMEIIPSKDKPKIIWIRVFLNKAYIEKKIKSFQYFLTSLDYQIDKRALKFHITLGRVKREIELPELDRFQKINLEGVSLDTITFYQSFLTNKGPNYNIIKSIYIKGDKNGERF